MYNWIVEYYYRLLHNARLQITFWLFALSFYDVYVFHDVTCLRLLLFSSYLSLLYGQFSRFHVCFCGLDPGNLKLETVRTTKQRICFRIWDAQFEILRFEIMKTDRRTSLGQGQGGLETVQKNTIMIIITMLIITSSYLSLL